MTLLNGILIGSSGQVRSVFSQEEEDETVHVSVQIKYLDEPFYTEAMVSDQSPEQALAQWNSLLSQGWKIHEERLWVLYFRGETPVEFFRAESFEDACQQMRAFDTRGWFKSMFGEAEEYNPIDFGVDIPTDEELVAWGEML